MQIDSLQFGTVEYDEEAVLHFPEGLLGFPHLTKLVQVRPDDWQPVEFLLPIDEPRLAFPVINPFLVRGGEYPFELADSDRASLGLDETNGVEVYVVATFGKSAEESTINLLAPVLVNPTAKRGRQVVLEGSGYSVTERMLKPTDKNREVADAGHTTQAR